jgi:hypothetical protein
VFGIGTQSNNTLAAATVLPTDAWGNVAASLNSRSLTGFLDSGSNGLFFTDSALAQCGGNLGTFFCPSTVQSFSAALTAKDGTKGTASFNVANAQSLLGSGNNYAANNLAGQFGSVTSLDLGLPFFYGRYVYYGQSSGGKAPYVAF